MVGGGTNLTEAVESLPASCQLRGWGGVLHTWPTLDSTLTLALKSFDRSVSAAFNNPEFRIAANQVI